MNLLNNPKSRQEPVASRKTIIERFLRVRCDSSQIIEPLTEEDCLLQSMPDVSPLKWHLAHTTWFFETLVLKPTIRNYRAFNPTYEYLFNSYYNAIGGQYPRSKRGLISRPGLSEVLDYRSQIEQQIVELLAIAELTDDQLETIELGIQHEQQHQELMLMDLKHAWFQNPGYPYYPNRSVESKCTTESNISQEIEWLDFAGGLITVGASTENFSFDNERPCHQQYLYPFKFASRLVNNAEYLEFINDGGYENPLLWLSDGWLWLQQKKQQAAGLIAHQEMAPLYWLNHQQEWFEYSLDGLQPLDRDQPVSHINYFEAQAYASWAARRLPTEYEWEVAAQNSPDEKNHYSPNVGNQSIELNSRLRDILGTLWQWTSSAYSAYPGFKPFSGNAAEYNGKFMSGQFVLRGGSCVTPEGHVRLSYRNFFYPHQQWMFSGIRLAEDN